MMADAIRPVVDLSAHRAAREARAPDAPAQCSTCGSHWFTLTRPTPTGENVGGAVTLNAHGTVTGYAGIPTCTDCGSTWEPNAPKKI